MAAAIITAWQYCLIGGVFVFLMVAALPPVLLWWPRMNSVPLQSSADDWQDRYVEKMRNASARMTRSMELSLISQWNALPDIEKQQFKEKHSQLATLYSHSDAGVLRPVPNIHTSREATTVEATVESVSPKPMLSRRLTRKTKKPMQGSMNVKGQRRRKLKGDRPWMYTHKHDNHELH